MNSEPSIANLAEVQSNSGDESLADLDSTSCGYTSDVAAEYSNFYKGLGELKKWSDLPEILEKDNKKVVPVDGRPFQQVSAYFTFITEYCRHLPKFCTLHCIPERSTKTEVAAML